MKKVLQIVFVITAFLSRFTYAQTGANDMAMPNFKFINNDSIVDLGAIAVNTGASYQFDFKNTGGKELVIMNMYIAGNGIGPDSKLNIRWPGKPIKPGKKGTITISFASKNAVGSFLYEIYLSSNATVENYRLFQIKGAVIPKARKPEDKLEVNGIFKAFTPVMRANTR